LVAAALADFSAAALAVVATSQAFWEASSSASRDAMRALAIDKASATWKRGKRKPNKELGKDKRDRQKTQHSKETYPEKLEQLSRIRHIQCPKRRISSSKSKKKENMRRKVQTVKEQATRSNTYIVSRNHRSMGVKGSTSHSGLLQTFRGTRVTLLNRGFWRLHHRTSFLRRRFIGSRSINGRSNGSIPFRVLVVTAKETKSKYFA
jgi:hypothetical protein